MSHLEKYNKELVEWWREIDALHENSPRGLLPPGGTKFLVLAIRDWVDTGYMYAYASGCEHRLSKHQILQRLVHSPTLQVVGVGDPLPGYEQPVNFNSLELYDAQPHQLGSNPLGLFGYLGVPKTYPAYTLFLYPENLLVPRQIQQFVHKVAGSSVSRALIITKNPVILTDFVREEIRILEQVS